jgi:nicotinic acid phosphoribosyltransferase
MNNRENAWALEQAARYAEKLTEAKAENQKLKEQLELIQETLDQAKKEIQYLNKLNHTQQQYITKLENHTDSNPIKKETKIRTIADLKVVNEDAC